MRPVPERRSGRACNYRSVAAILQNNLHNDDRRARGLCSAHRRGGRSGEPVRRASAGQTPEVRERFYAISVERRLKHAAVLAITQAAREELFVGA